MSDFISSEAETNIGHNPSRRLLGFISLEKRVFRMDFDICHLRNHKHLWDLNVVPSRFLFLALSLSLSLYICLFLCSGGNRPFLHWYVAIVLYDWRVQAS